MWFAGTSARYADEILQPVLRAEIAYHQYSAPAIERLDSLYFDAAPKVGLASRMLSRLRRRTGEVADVPPVMPSATPTILADLRNWLCRQAERGVAWDASVQARSELAARAQRLTAAGARRFAARLNRRTPQPDCCARSTSVCSTSIAWMMEAMKRTRERGASRSLVRFPLSAR
jgi:hypothetical protein